MWVGWCCTCCGLIIERNSVVSASIECSVLLGSVFLFYLSLFLIPFPSYLPPPFLPPLLPSSGDIVSSVMDEEDDLEDIESATDRSGEIVIFKSLHYTM